MQLTDIKYIECFSLSHIIPFSKILYYYTVDDTIDYFYDRENMLNKF